MNRFHCTMELHVTGPDSINHFEFVVDEAYKLEVCNEAVSDGDWAYTEQDDHGEVEVSMLITADDEDEAGKIADSYVRSAIQAAGGFTPNWGERVDQGSTVYRLSDEQLVPA